MSRESVMGFELAIDLISERLGRFKLCKPDREALLAFLGNLGTEVRRRKLEELDLELQLGP